VKRVYWRPPAVSRAALLLVAAVACALLVAVERLKVRRQQPYYAEKLAAAELAQRAMAVIKAEKLRRGLRVDPETDPTESGMIGEAITPVTANTGYLSAKQRSVDANFAAVMVALLMRAGVAPGDRVAVGVSGSFPALNVSIYAALATVRADPVVIASASASEWGANHIDYLWLDMERTLVDQRSFAFRSIASSLGGIDDRAYGISKEGRVLLTQCVERAGIPLIDPKGLVDSIDQRMVLYDQRAGGKSYKAYINVGGGTASVGTHVGKKQFKPGLNLRAPQGEGIVDSVMLRFATRDVPVIHVTSIEDLAKQFDLKEPQAGRVVAVGEGGVYAKLEYRRWLAGVALALLFAVMVLFIRLDFGFRLFRSSGTEEKRDAQPQQMI
jgi:poly-gamma-glutamate system protein